MNRRAAGVLVALAGLVIVAGALGWIRASRRPAPVAPAPGAAVQSGDAPPETLERRTVTLWLPGAAGRLTARDVEVESAPELKPRLGALVAALLAAPDDASSTAVFPAPVAAGALVLATDGTLYVDLRPADGGPPPGAGSTLETQRIYSIVHTLLRNEPSVAAVVLLWNGVQRESLSGHVDTRRPLVARPDLEAR